LRQRGGGAEKNHVADNLAEKKKKNVNEAKKNLPSVYRTSGAGGKGKQAAHQSNQARNRSAERGKGITHPQVHDGGKSSKRQN